MRCSKSVLLTLVAIIAISGSPGITSARSSSEEEMTTKMDMDAPMVTEDYSSVPEIETDIIEPFPTTVISSTEPSMTTHETHEMHEMTTIAPTTTTAVFTTTTTEKATTTSTITTTTPPPSTTTTTTTTTPQPSTTSTTTTMAPPKSTKSTTTTTASPPSTTSATTTTVPPPPPLKAAASTHEESYGSPCASESDCPKNKIFQCIKKSCQCEPSQIFDLRQQRCVIPLGKECYSDPSCPEFAECFLERCVCKTGYSMHTLTKCKADDPERKTVLWPRQPKQDNSDKSSCTPSSCDATKGLKCQVGGACECKDSKEIFVEEFGRCLNTTMQKTLKDALRLVASPNLNLNSLVKLLEKFEETDQATGASTNYNGPVHQLINLLNDQNEKKSRPSESQIAPFSSKNFGDEDAAAQEPVPESTLPSSGSEMGSRLGSGGGGNRNHDFDSISPVAQAPEESIEPLTFSRESGEAIKKPAAQEPQRTYLPLDDYQPQSQEPAIVQRQAPGYGYHPYHHDHGHDYHPHHGDGYQYGAHPESTNLFGRGGGQSQGGPGQFFRQGINEGLGQGAIGGGINGYLGRPPYRANLANKFIHGLGHELGYGLADPFVNSIGAAIGNRFRHRGNNGGGGGGNTGGAGGAGGGGGGGGYGPAPGYYGGQGGQPQPQGFGGPGGGHGPGPGGYGGQGGFGGPGDGHHHHHHHHPPGGGGFGGPGDGYGGHYHNHGPGGGYGGGYGSGPGGVYGRSPGGVYGRGPGGGYGGGPVGGQGAGGFGGPGGGQAGGHYHNHGPGGGFGGQGGGQGGGGQGGGFGGQGGFAPRHQHGLGSLGGPGGAGGGHGQQDLGGLGAGSIGGAGPHHRHRPLLIELAKFAVKSFKLLDRVLPLTSAITDALRKARGPGGGGGGGHLGAGSENREIRYGEENPEDLIKEGGILSGFAKFIGKLLRLRTRLEQSDDGRLKNLLL